MLPPGNAAGLEANVMTLYGLEQALDSGRLFVLVSAANDRWWKARRNGMTKRWKRQPQRFRIPIKAGFKLTGAITDHDLDPVASWLQVR